MIVRSAESTAGPKRTNVTDRWAADPQLTLSSEALRALPIYSADPLVRRAASLQKTADARAPVARVNRVTLTKLGLAPDGKVRMRSASGEAGSCTDPTSG